MRKGNHAQDMFMKKIFSILKSGKNIASVILKSRPATVHGRGTKTGLITKGKQFK